MPSERVSTDTRAQALEQRRSRGEISCAECRRLKLKCDKMVPCSSCVRRGCPGICPNKVQPTQHVNRPTLSDTERLRKKLESMSNRIRTLEDALQIANNSAASTEPHPLLANDLLGIKKYDTAPNPPPDTSILDNKEEYLEGALASFATLRLSDNGIGESYYAGPDAFLMSQHFASPRPPPSAKLPENLAFLSRHFPFERHFYLAPEDIQKAMESKLPSYARATSLIECFLDSIAWFFGVLDRDYLYEDLLPVVYGKNPHMMNREQAPLSKADPHELSLLFAVLALGATSDLTQCPQNEESLLYHHLSRGALTQRSVFESANLSTVQAIVLIGLFDLCSCREVAVEGTWRMVSFGLSLGISIGLHRDPQRFNLSPKEVQRRRRILWELVCLDCWRSIGSGRPAILHPSVIDCEFPEDRDARLNENGEEVLGLPRMRHKFAKEVLFPISMTLNKGDSLRYSEILACDQTVREFGPSQAFHDSVLAALKYDEVQETSRSRVRAFLSKLMKDLVLLSLHRNFFARALHENPVNPMRGMFGPSFLSGYRTATTMVRMVKEIYEENPVLVVRIWPIWAHCLVALVMLGAVAQTPACSLAKQALADFDSTLELFSSAHEHPVVKVGLPVLLKMRQSAYEGLYGHSGGPLPNLRSQSSTHQDPATPDSMSNSTFADVGTQDPSPTQASPFVAHTNTTHPFNPPLSMQGLSNVQPYEGQACAGTVPPPSFPFEQPGFTSTNVVDNMTSTIAHAPALKNDQSTNLSPFTSFLESMNPTSSAGTPQDFDVSFDMRPSTGAEMLFQDMATWQTVMQDNRYFDLLSANQNQSQHSDNAL